MREVSFEQAEWPEFLNIINEVFNKGKSFHFKARGSSMHPCIRNGDILTIESADAFGLKNGDIALYRTADDKLVTHRIIGIDVSNKVVILKARGDSLFGPVEHINEEQVLGRVVSVQRGKKIIKLHQGFSFFLWVRCYPFFQIIFWSLKIVKKMIFLVLRRFRLLETNHL
jgi:signal peptidase I